MGGDSDGDWRLRGQEINQGHFNTLNTSLGTTAMGTQCAFHGHEPPKTQVSGTSGAADLMFLGADDEIRTRDPHLGKKRLWSPSVQSVYCAAVLHSPENRPSSPSVPSSSYTGLPSPARYGLSLPSVATIQAWTACSSARCGQLGSAARNATARSSRSRTVGSDLRAVRFRESPTVDHEPLSEHSNRRGVGVDRRRKPFEPTSLTEQHSEGQPPVRAGTQVKLPASGLWSMSLGGRRASSTSNTGTQKTGRFNHQQRAPQQVPTPTRT